MFFVPPPLLRTVRFPSLKESLTTLGLTTNLKLVLDAGDVDSYPNGQKWLDRSGGGYDFNLGADATASATDPTFVGNYGNQYQEYFSSDGGDYFTYDAANETWMNSLHKAGSVSFLAIVYIATDADTILFSTSTDWPAVSGGTPVGLVFGYSPNLNSAGFLKRVWISRPTLTTSNSYRLTDTAMTVPNLFILIGSEVYNSDGSVTSIALVNGVSRTASATAHPDYAPLSSNPPNIAKAFSFTNAGTPAPNGSRLYGLAIWQGTALSLANQTAIWDAIRGRYGL